MKSKSPKMQVLGDKDGLGEHCLTFSGFQVSASIFEILNTGLNCLLTTL